ncbi:hypothetical protein VPH35_090035 [Triticum aestivum]
MNGKLWTILATVVLEAPRHAENPLSLTVLWIEVWPRQGWRKASGRGSSAARLPMMRISFSSLLNWRGRRRDRELGHRVRRPSPPKFSSSFSYYPIAQDRDRHAGHGRCGIDTHHSYFLRSAQFFTGEKETQMVGCDLCRK